MAGPLQGRRGKVAPVFLVITIGVRLFTMTCGAACGGWVGSRSLGIYVSRAALTSDQGTRLQAESWRSAGVLVGLATE
jgi:hypothetical protein